MKILYIGPWARDQALFGRKAANQAATAWSRGLIHALMDSGCSVRVCTHCREQFWPLGELRPGNEKDFFESCPVRFSRYLNIPLRRDFSLMDVYRKMVQKEVANDRPDIVLLYNMEPYYSSVTEVLTAQGVRWIPIILDENEVGARGWDLFSQRVNDADGLVFLSYWGFANCLLAIPKLHLAGGVRAENIEVPSDLVNQREKSVVYSGVYDEGYGGLERLFEIFAAVATPGCRFVLTGKDAKGNLKKYLRKEARATYAGFVSQDELQSIHAAATVFVNPRPSEASENRMTFPSKLLEYLSYGKPIVSTWTEGLSPEYREVLLIPQENTPEAFARLIDEALNYSHDEKFALQRRIAVWASEHTWREQVKRLVEFMESF
jgi:glycosyltransferase involved in cell wall biosynthesis